MTAVGRVATIGDSCIDVYAGSPRRTAVGGNALNVAVNLVRRGLESEYIGVVGDDENGLRIRRALELQGVHTKWLHAREGATWVAYVGIHHGAAVVHREERGVSGPYSPTAEELAAMTAYRHVHLTNLAEPAATVKHLAQLGVSTSYDYGTSRADSEMGPTDVAFFSYPGASGGEAHRLATAAVEKGAGLAVVTSGSTGSVAYDGERVTEVSAVPTDSVDTLGAGDSYIATFLSQRLSAAPLEAAMKAASREASGTCLHWAAWPQELMSAAEA